MHTWHVQNREIIVENLGGNNKNKMVINQWEKVINYVIWIIK